MYDYTIIKSKLERTVFQLVKRELNRVNYKIKVMITLKIKNVIRLAVL